VLCVSCVGMAPGGATASMGFCARRALRSARPGGLRRCGGGLAWTNGSLMAQSYLLVGTMYLREMREKQKTIIVH
jgi:hypothetical protein